MYEKTSLPPGKIIYCNILKNKEIFGSVKIIC